MGVTHALSPPTTLPGFLFSLSPDLGTTHINVSTMPVHMRRWHY